MPSRVSIDHASPVADIRGPQKGVDAESRRDAEALRGQWPNRGGKHAGELHCNTRHIPWQPLRRYEVPGDDTRDAWRADAVTRKTRGPAVWTARIILRVGQMLVMLECWSCTMYCRTRDRRNQQKPPHDRKHGVFYPAWSHKYILIHCQTLIVAD
jgi:hypothetical protein